MLGMNTWLVEAILTALLPGNSSLISMFIPCCGLAATMPLGPRRGGMADGVVGGPWVSMGGLWT